MRNEKIEMGDLVQDAITGHTGIAGGFTRYLNGCEQWLVMAQREKKDKDDKTDVWHDAQRLEVVTKGVFDTQRYTRRTGATIPGGPSSPTRRAE